ncbi:MAG: ferritin-like domain-containing protein [Actinomycetota bacterium]|nr:ferritin-like domain-containing protein [Actinomycetota bacterium]
MSHHLDIDKIDTSGLVRETAEAAGMDRRDLLRKGAVGAGGLVAGGAFFGILSPAEARISTKRSKRNDVKILQFAMTLELLEAAFYRQARANNVFGDDAPLERFTRTVSAHEDDHVTFLGNALGRKRVSGLKFDFGEAVTNRDTYRATAQVLEDTGVQAYLGQAGNVSQRPVLLAAGSIVTVEARHASWIRFLNGGGVPNVRESALPAPRTFDRPASERAILRAVRRTGFIES